MQDLKVKTYEVPEKLSKYEASIKKTIQISNEIYFKAGETLPWDSKIGGCPYLLSKDDYPINKDMQPMMFLVQLNLSEIHGLPELPDKGLLQFFIEDDDMFGMDGNVIVRYIEAFTEDENKCLSEIPYTINRENAPYYNEGKMSFEAVEMIYSSTLESYEEVLGTEELNEEESDALYDEAAVSGCRVGGYPYFVQHDYGFDPKSEFLLLQLDCDDEVGMMFGDAGTAQFIISREDIKKKDFSKVDYDWQCC
jgi:uncharacterized protein YwqG